MTLDGVQLALKPTTLHADCPSHRLSLLIWQVLGGAGYVSDYPVEQLYRDNRLNMIHEGTAGRHAKRLLVIASDGP